MSEVGEGQEAERDNTRFIEVSGPIKLEEGKNFYDQPPFDWLMSQAAQNVKISLEDFRFFFSRLCVNELRVKTSLPPVTFTPELALQTPIEDLGRLLRRHDSMYSSQRIGASMKYFLQQLGRNHYSEADIMEYVRGKFDRGLYKGDGTYSPQPAISEPTAVLPHSYMTWLEEKQAREGRVARGAVLHVLGDTFSQQLRGNTLTESIAASGGNPNRRSWKLIVPTGVVHPRPPQPR